MTVNVNVFVQVLATILQVMNAVNVAQLPAKWQAGFTGAFTIFQAVMGIIAHYYTPTGVQITAGSTIKTPEAPDAQSAHT
jgi:hypothetical protein